jgi:hypothetical protein
MVSGLSYPRVPQLSFRIGVIAVYDVGQVLQSFQEPGKVVKGTLKAGIDLCLKGNLRSPTRGQPITSIYTNRLFVLSPGYKRLLAQ